ncbi:hypothetical protein [Streptomyces sp. NBC_00286]|uniref:hypothetical protein n=1 Tax=Streptomyces sp. NBC_00286 TaxID=2975701 RepID=UPI002E29C6CA|nr:hypothetical protein [Streptomyces sp. NBC_00286]
MSSRTDRRNWVWLPSRLRFRVLGLIDVVALWVVVSALVGAGAWWGLDAYRDSRDYCTENQELRRVDTAAGEECIGVTAEAYAFDPDLADVMGRIEGENKAARKSGKPVVSVAVMMPYTSTTPGAAMSKELIRHALQGAYVAQYGHNHGAATDGTAVQLLFANVGEDLTQWKTVTGELAARRTGKAPLVAAIGFPNSDTATLESVQKGLGHKEVRIPAVSAVLSSREMEHSYLFKVSPSTDQLVDALKRYVIENEVNRKDTFLIADEQDDNYVENLRKVFLEEFGEEYGIRTDDAVGRRIAVYRGSKGSDRGDAQDFRQAVDAMCAAGVKTVFLAGRDADLRPFLETLDHRSPCDWGTDAEPLRILRVSTGRDPVTESPRMRQIAERNHIEIVTAAAVDAPRWVAGSGGDEEVPRFFGDFAASYGQYFSGEDAAALNDGYAVMYHDALTAVGTAVAAAQGGQDNPVDHDDVYDALRRGSPSERCVGCVPGASGVFTFVDENIGLDKGARNEAVVGRWPVCKPVPVVTFPKERQDKSPLYRTYQGRGEACPPP